MSRTFGHTRYTHAERERDLAPLPKRVARRQAVAMALREEEDVPMRRGTTAQRAAARAAADRRAAKLANARLAIRSAFGSFTTNWDMLCPLCGGRHGIVAPLTGGAPKYVWCPQSGLCAERDEWLALWLANADRIPADVFRLISADG